MKNIVLISLIIILFSGCGVIKIFKKKGDHTKATNFNTLTKKLTTYSFCSKIKENNTLYITDFVNESNLENRSQLGFLLSNHLKVNILKDGCTKNVTIKTFNLANNLKIGKNGSKILSRELKELKVQNLEDDKQIIVGTYIITKKQLILFIKLIDLKSGNTVASESKATYITNEIKELEGINTNNDPIIYTPFHL